MDGISPGNPATAKAVRISQAMSELTLRLQSSTGSSVLSNVPAGTTFADFCNLVASRLGSASTDFQLLAGFPPKPLQLQPGDSIGGALQNGDSLRVKFASETAAAAPKQATVKVRKDVGFVLCACVCCVCCVCGLCVRLELQQRAHWLACVFSLLPRQRGRRRARLPRPRRRNREQQADPRFIR